MKKSIWWQNSIWFLVSLLCVFFFSSCESVRSDPCGGVLTNPYGQQKGNLLIFYGIEYGGGFYKEGIFVYDLDNKKLINLSSLTGNQGFDWSSDSPGRLGIQDEKFNKICDINLEGEVFNQHSYLSSWYFLSPLGDRVAFIDKENRAYLVDLKNEQAREIDTQGYAVFDLSWNPDGETLLMGLTSDIMTFYSSQGSFKLATVLKDGTGLSFMTKKYTGLCNSMEWSPDGSWVTFNQIKPGMSYLRGVQFSHPLDVKLFYSSDKVINNAVWSFNSRKIAMSVGNSEGGDIEIIDLDTGKVEVISPSKELLNMWRLIHSVRWVTEDKLAVAGTLKNDPNVKSFGEGYSTFSLHLLDINTKEIVSLASTQFTSIQKLTYWDMTDETP